MRIEAFKLSQWGQRGIVEIWSCVFRAGDLIHLIQVDRWTPENYGGYQRAVSERRLGMSRGSALRYLSKELGVFPSSILLNLRGRCEFEEEHYHNWYSRGVLDTKEAEFWLIDGQHRVEALKRAIARNRDFEDYPVITSVLKLPDRFDEMLLFYIVNRRQRGVKTDLVYRHLQRMLWQKGEEWVLDFVGKAGLNKSYSIEIVDVLNNEPMSPWNNRIRFVGEPKHIDHIVTDKRVSLTVLPLLEESAFKGMPINDIAWALIDFWNALYRIYPDCVNMPKKYSLMQKPGLTSMNKLFPVVYTNALRRGKADEESMYIILISGDHWIRVSGATKMVPPSL